MSDLMNLAEETATELKQRIIALRVQEGSRDAVVSQLENDVSDLAKRNEELEKQVEVLTKSNLSIGLDNYSLTRKTNYLADSNQGLRKQIHELKQQLAAGQPVGDLEAEVSDLKVKLANRDKSLESLLDDIKDLRDNLKRSEAVNAWHERTEKAQRETIDSLEASTLNHKYERLGQMYHKLELDNAALRHKVHGLVGKNEELRQEVNLLVYQKKSLEKEVQELKLAGELRPETHLQHYRTRTGNYVYVIAGYQDGKFIVYDSLFGEQSVMQPSLFKAIFESYTEAK